MLTLFSATRHDGTVTNDDRKSGPMTKNWPEMWIGGF